ncbi:actin-like ATPase domain-containing protein [Anaeromyces robustus]|uniref:Actin-like ATPase domain-containing protein n=1 Tax=Anaeromyces robustus TaxID=1754192 RepID=A0A1Y1XI28_9FUNG|nr:actin-like ATPase domain-containing protein [Anaeromyces robustus]|eukprot:ORX85405.1 actin-like ATPase domain-containing protein [Anaeromyces robustus]
MDNIINKNSRETEKIYEISEDYTYSIPNTLTNYEEHRTNNTPLIIDIGTNQTNAGWATDASPYLQFSTVVSKFRDRKTSRNVIYIGNEIYRGETISRSNLRTPYDSNVLINSELLEYMMDYIFLKLGINTNIENPIVMTETLCNPNYSRKLVSELMFECYNVPSICYGIDSLFSYYQNNDSFDNGIIISSGNHSTNVIPIVDNRGILNYSQRLNYGGFEAAEYMLKQLQFKYPTFPSKMTNSQAQEITQKYCHVSLDYSEELEKISKPESRQDDIIIQFPFTPIIVEEIDEEELKRREQLKKEQGNRLQKQAAKQREEKLKQKTAYLEELEKLMELKNEDEEAFKEGLDDYEMDDENDLKKTIEKLTAYVTRANNKKLGIEETETKEKPVFPLLDIPDDQLTPEERNQKKRQKMLKASYEAREKIKKEKEEERLRIEEEKRKEEEKRLKDPEGYLKNLYKQHDDIVQKIKERKKRKNQLTDRRSQVSQSRMRSIAHLADDEDLAPKRRRRGQDEDTFGLNDEDWSIYRAINKDEHSDTEEEEMNQFNHLEKLLKQYDPNFIPQSVIEKNEKKKTIISQLSYGLDGYDEDNQAQQYQIRLNVEQIRIPEVLFQPSIVGLDQAGIIEIVNDALKRFSQDQQNEMVKNIFLTGGNINFPNMKQRIVNEIKSILPFKTIFNVKQANDPVLDAWRGAAKWSNISNQEHFKKSCITRQMYDEYGHDYLIEFPMSNKYINL